MILHQQAPTPEECQKPDGSCHECKFFKQCRDFVLNRHGKSSKSIREIELIARRNSLGALQWEDYNPDK